jgi:hypothetical protein
LSSTICYTEFILKTYDQEYTIEDCSEKEIINTDNEGSFMSFLLGGLFANLFMPKKQNSTPIQYITDTNLEGNHSSEHSLCEEEKDFLSLVWSFEKEIKKAEKEGKWVRLYCLLQAVRHLNETQWRKFIDASSDTQTILDENLLGLLNYILKINPETNYWPKVSQRVKEDLERGGLNIELDDLSFTFHGKPLTEEPW